MSALQDFLGAETQQELQLELKNLILELVREEYHGSRTDLTAWGDLGSPRIGAFVCFYALNSGS